MTPPAEVAARRAAAQQLVPGPARLAAETVEGMLALQAQDFAGGLWAVAVRNRASETRADIEAALNAGTVVRSWPMRGTLHLTTPRDLRLLLAVSSARGVAAATGRRTQLGLTIDQLAQGRNLAIEALTGGRAATRTELMTELSDRGFDTTGQRAPHLLGWLAQTGVVCLGPMRGKQQAIVLLDEWAPAPHPPPERDDALREVTLRYVRGHGPVAAPDLAWWLGITKTEAARALDAAEPDLDRIDTEAGALWLAPDSPAADAAAVAAAADEVRLLPPFDELLLGYTDRSPSLDPVYTDRVTPGSNGLFRPVVSLGGRIAGTWRVERGRPPSVAFDPFVPFPEDALPALHAAGDAHLRFAAFR